MHCNATGCGIYAQRPVDPCQTFVCGWRTDGSVLPDWMRPDQCKAIVLLDRMRWRDQPVTIAVAAGAQIPERTLNWLKQHAQLYNRPLLWEEYEEVAGQFTGRKRIATHGTAELGHEMLERHGRGELLW
jgi:hypothetical protein